MIFDPVLYPLPITRIKQVTPGKVDGTTGVYSDKKTARSLITGSLHDGSQVSKTGLPSAQSLQFTNTTTVIDLGSRVIHTGTLLEVGDQLEITESDESISQWAVTGQVRDYSIIKKYLGISWYAFSLKLISPTPLTSPTQINESTTAEYDATHKRWELISACTAILAVTSAAETFKGSTPPTTTAPNPSIPSAESWD